MFILRAAETKVVTLFTFSTAQDLPEDATVVVFGEVAGLSGAFVQTDLKLAELKHGKQVQLAVPALRLTEVKLSYQSKETNQPVSTAMPSKCVAAANAALENASSYQFSKQDFAQ